VGSKMRKEENDPEEFKKCEFLSLNSIIKDLNADYNDAMGIQRPGAFKLK
jgi:hypothetical protein